MSKYCDKNEANTIRVILLPGMACDQLLWQDVIKVLPHTLNIQFISLVNKTNEQAMLEALSQSMTGNAYTCLVGFSMGGYIALEYLLSQHHEVDACVFASFSAQGYTPSNRTKRLALIKRFQEHTDDWLSPERLSLWLDRKHPNFEDNLALVLKMAKAAGMNEFIQQQMATLNRKNRIRQLSQVTIPVLLLRGTEDNLITSTAVKVMHDNLPISEWYEIPSSGHMIPIEQPKMFVEIFTCWLYRIISEANMESGN